MVQNATYRSIHDWIMSHEHVMVAKAARYTTSIGVDRQYFAQVKTDCILLSRLPTKHVVKCKAIASWMYRDGTPKYRREPQLEPEGAIPKAMHELPTSPGPKVFDIHAVP